MKKLFLFSLFLSLFVFNVAMGQQGRLESGQQLTTRTTLAETSGDITFYWKESSSWMAVQGGIGTITLKDIAKFTQVGNIPGDYHGPADGDLKLSFENDQAEGVNSTCISAVNCPFIVAVEFDSNTKLYAPASCVVLCDVILLGN